MSDQRGHERPQSFSLRFLSDRAEGGRVLSLDPFVLAVGAPVELSPLLRGHAALLQQARRGTVTHNGRRGVQPFPVETVHYWEIGRRSPEVVKPGLGEPILVLFIAGERQRAKGDRR